MRGLWWILAVFSSAESSRCFVISWVESLLEQLLHRAPCLVNIEAQQLKCGPESITPDGKYIMGRVPEVRIFSDDAQCFLLILFLCSLYIYVINVLAGMLLGKIWEDFLKFSIPDIISYLQESRISLNIYCVTFAQKVKIFNFLLF